MNLRVNTWTDRCASTAASSDRVQWSTRDVTRFLRRRIAWDDDLRDGYGALRLRSGHEVGLRRLPSPSASPSSPPPSSASSPSVSARLYADWFRVSAGIRHQKGHGRPREDYRRERRFGVGRLVKLSQRSSQVNFHSLQFWYRSTGLKLNHCNCLLMRRYEEILNKVLLSRFHTYPYYCILHITLLMK